MNSTLWVPRQIYRRWLVEALDVWNRKPRRISLGCVYFSSEFFFLIDPEFTLVWMEGFLGLSSCNNRVWSVYVFAPTTWIQAAPMGLQQSGDCVFLHSKPGLQVMWLAQGLEFLRGLYFRSFCRRFWCTKFSQVLCSTLRLQQLNFVCQQFGIFAQ